MQLSTLIILHQCSQSTRNSTTHVTMSLSLQWSDLPPNKLLRYVPYSLSRKHASHFHLFTIFLGVRNHHKHKKCFSSQGVAWNPVEPVSSLVCCKGIFKGWGMKRIFLAFSLLEHLNPSHAARNRTGLEKRRHWTRAIPNKKSSELMLGGRNS